ncbi:MAG: PAS domain S-box protein [Promethearchaeota archaeon]|nr:MAG: PAS domain S-box protein [Candidatus Lokiarchaeota archaeon]
MVAIQETNESKGIQKPLKIDKTLRFFLQSTTDIAFLKDNNFRYIWVNHAFEDLVNLSSDEIIGKEDFEILPAEIAKPYRKSDKATLQDKKNNAMIFEEKFNKRFFQTQKFRVELPNSKIGIGGIVRDITEYKKTLSALQESEDRYHSIFRTSADAILIYNLEGEVVESNPSACKMYGYTSEEMTQLTLEDIVHPDYLHQVNDYLEQIEKENKFSGESVEIRKDGSYFDIEVHGSPIIFKGERHILAMIRDITDRKKAERKLKDSEEKYRRLFTTVSNGWAYHEIVLDENGKPINFVILEVNKAYENITNTKKEEIVGKKITEIFPQMEHLEADVISIFGEVALTGEPRKLEFYYEPRELWLSISVTSSKKGHFVTVIEDITKRKEVEKERKVLLQKLTAVNQRLSHLLSNNPTIIYNFEIHPDGSFIIPYISNNVKEILGYDIDYLTQDPKIWQTLVHPDDLETYIKTRQEIDGEKRITKEYRLKDKNGNYHWFYDSMLSLPSDETKVVIGSLTDITDRKKIEEALKESEKRFRTLFEDSRDVIYATAKDGSIIYMNPAGFELFGYTKDEIQEIDVEELYYNKKDRYDKFIPAIHDKDRIKDFELKLKKKNGEPIACLLTSSARRNEKGEIIGYHGIIRDITESKQLRQELKQQRDELESFATTMAHDLRGKLQLISLYSSMLETEVSSKIDDQIEEITDFLEKLLFLAKKGKVIDEMENVNLNELVRKVRKKIIPLEKAIQFEIKSLPTIQGDKMRLEEVFENVFINILEHSKADKVFIQSRELKDQYKITIQDNGIGISSEKLLEIEKSIETKNYKSFGLIIINKIINAHQGEFKIKSSNNGTTVMLYFPKNIRN